MKRGSIVAAVAGAALLAPATALGQAEVVADRLNNPRQVTTTPDGSVYVAEAGRGGSNCIVGSPTPEEPPSEFCQGYTSSVTRVKPSGRTTRVTTGITSFAGRDGSFASGLSAVDLFPRGMRGIVNEDATDLAGEPFGKGSLGSGRLLRLPFFSRPFNVAKVSDFERANNPAGGPVDSNPYGVLSRRDGDYVADAGGNTILRVRGGRTELVAVMPETATGSESVPTSLAEGPDGSIYVGELAALTPNSARIFRLAADGTPEVVASGLNAVVGIDVDDDGNVYAAEFTTDPTTFSPVGDVVKITPAGVQTKIGVGELSFPGGVGVADNGDVYVSNASVLPSSTPNEPPFFGLRGQLLRFPAGAARAASAKRSIGRRAAQLPRKAPPGL